MRNRERLLARIAASQQGAFTRAQALRCGFSETTIDRRVRSGLYERLEPTVYAASASQSSHGREVMASVLSTGGLAAASHATAAYLWGMLSRPPKRVDVVTTRWDRVRRSAMVHESLDLQEGDLTAIDGIPVTTAARTVVDLGAMLPRMVPSALDAGLRMDLFTLDEVARFIARVAKRGRRGVGVIRPLIGRRRGWENTTESELEDRFRRIVGSSTLSMPIPQFVVTDKNGWFICRSDFAYPESKVLIELDGMAYHADAETFQRDRTKQNRALAAGWRTVRFTWEDVVNDPGTVLTVR